MSFKSRVPGIRQVCFEPRQVRNIYALLAIASVWASASADTISSDCSIKGIKLHGKVQVVDSFPDLKVQIVSSFPDLKVETVSSFANDCGRWQFVDSFPDFKIQYVESFPDLKIEFVNSFPGTP